MKMSAVSGAVIAKEKTPGNYFTYVLECADGTLYVGCTNNLEKRLLQHNESGKGAHYTKIRRPVVLKYSESFATRGEALRREYEIKSWTRGKKLKLIGVNLKQKSGA